MSSCEEVFVIVAFNRTSAPLFTVWDVGETATVNGGLGFARKNSATRRQATKVLMAEQRIESSERNDGNTRKRLANAETVKVDFGAGTFPICRRN